MDEVPQELSTLVAYLENIASELMIDLVAVNSFDIGGTQAILPQRVTPERHEVMVKQTRLGNTNPGNASRPVAGSEEFAASIDAVPEENQQDMRRLLKWARELEARGLAILYNSIGTSGRYTLQPRTRGYDAGLVTIWNENNRAYLTHYRTVFDRKAAEFIEQVEELSGVRIGQGNSLYEFSDELLNTLTKAYDAAADS